MCKIIFRLAFALATTGCWFGAPAWAVDWPQFLGPGGNGVSADIGWNTQWNKKEPQELWRANVGTGCGSISVAEGRAYAIGQKKAGEDTVWCLDAVSGEKVWEFSYPQKLEPTYYSGGPSTTPAIDGGRLYATSKDGELFCLDAAKGELIWRRSYVREFGGRKQTWGYASSPVIAGNLIICEPGGPDASVAALDKVTGQTVWKAGSDAPGYCTPLRFTHEGKDGLAFFNAFGLVAYDLAGKELFRHPWKTQYDVNAATPVFSNGRFLISSGYDTGAALIEVMQGLTHEVWRNKSLLQQFQNMILVNDHVYGVSGDNKVRAMLKCVDWKTGEVKWEERLRENRGNIILAEGKLLVLSESGELMLVQPDPKDYHVLGTIQVNRKPCWAPPAFSGGLFYSRNNDGQLTCFDLR